MNTAKSHNRYQKILEEVLAECFKDKEEIKRDELKKEMQKQLKIKFGDRKGLGLNKIDELLIDLNKKDIISQEMPRKPFKLNI